MPLPPRLIRRALQSLPLGVAAVAASIAVPSLAIWGVALRLRDAERIAAIASAVAEPLGLMGAAAMTVWGIRRLTRSTGGGPAAGAVTGAVMGGVAAAVCIGAAFWVHDVDAWTAATALALPALGAWSVRAPAGADLPMTTEERRQLGAPPARELSVERRDSTVRVPRG